MEKIPAETLELKFKELTLQNKFECILVCRQWADILWSRCLLHTVNILSIRAFDSFIVHMERDRSKSSQVERLIFRDCILHDFDRRILTTLFPKLRVLLMKLGLEPRESVRSYGLWLETLFPSNRLEHLLDFGKFELTC
jgi:radical SAM superfamily enzyme with C-terminal helix-hairpin-helix motif